MGCLSPIDVRRPDWAVVRRYISVPCGRCVGCRLERARNWTVRIMHEAQYQLEDGKESCFLTLTYRDEELSYGYTQATLVKSDLQKFWKRLRKEVGNVRYFACGEYGDRRLRPHFHAALFGFNFPDKTLLSTEGGNNLYHSDLLDTVWSHGYCSVGDLTPRSAAYVARYILDKKFGREGKEYAEKGIEPEYVVMSRKPGIGARFFEKYAGDIFPQDSCITESGTSKPPRYYDELRKKTHPEQIEAIKLERMRKSEEIPMEERLAKRMLSKIRFHESRVNSSEKKLH